MKIRMDCRCLCTILVLLTLTASFGVTAGTQRAHRYVNVTMPTGDKPAKMPCPSGWHVGKWVDTFELGTELSPSVMHGTDEIPEIYVRFRGHVCDRRYSTPEKYVAAVAEEWREQIVDNAKQIASIGRRVPKIKDYSSRKSSFKTIGGGTCPATKRVIDVEGQRYILITAIGSSKRAADGESIRPIYVLEAECPLHLWDASSKRIDKEFGGQEPIFTAIIAGLQVP